MDKSLKTEEVAGTTLRATDPLGQIVCTRAVGARLPCLSAGTMGSKRRPREESASAASERLSVPHSSRGNVTRGGGKEAVPFQLCLSKLLPHQPCSSHISAFLLMFMISLLPYSL